MLSAFAESVAAVERGLARRAAEFVVAGAKVAVRRGDARYGLGLTLTMSDAVAPRGECIKMKRIFYCA